MRFMQGAAKLAALAAALAVLLLAAPAGAVMAIGVGGGTLPYTFNALPSDASLTHPYWGSIIELAEVLELARAGHIAAHTERFPLERVTEAYERMRNGTLSGRAVITPNG